MSWNKTAFSKFFFLSPNYHGQEYSKALGTNFTKTLETGWYHNWKKDVQIVTLYECNFVDELLTEKEKYKGISVELDATFAEMAGF